jgi:hypothetical protein
MEERPLGLRVKLDVAEQMFVGPIGRGGHGPNLTPDHPGLSVT